jgi:hypothetical protein
MLIEHIEVKSFVDHSRAVSDAAVMTDRSSARPRRKPRRLATLSLRTFGKGNAYGAEPADPRLE